MSAASGSDRTGNDGRSFARLIPFAFAGEQMTLVVMHNPGMAPDVTVNDSSGLPYTRISARVPGVPLAEDEFFARTYGDPRDVALFLLNAGTFIDTGRSIPSGHVTLPVWRLA